MIEKAVIDRIEGGLAVLLLGDDGSRRMDVPRKQLPKGAKSGSWLKVELDGESFVRAEIDPEETERARQRIMEKLERLRRGEHRNNG